MGDHLLEKSCSLSLLAILIRGIKHDDSIHGYIFNSQWCEDRLVH